VGLASASAERGRSAENRAAAWYARSGYGILARNWRAGAGGAAGSVAGEIDLVCVCARSGILVICEVKSRRSDRFGDPAEAVTRAKQRRLRRLAVAFAAASPERFSSIRFDVACELGAKFRVIEDAF
jgi:putative endonuclease